MPIPSKKRSRSWVLPTRPCPTSSSLTSASGRFAGRLFVLAIPRHYCGGIGRVLQMVGQRHCRSLKRRGPPVLRDPTRATGPTPTRTASSQGCSTRSVSAAAPGPTPTRKSPSQARSARSASVAAPGPTLDLHPDKSSLVSPVSVRSGPRSDTRLAPSQVKGGQPGQRPQRPKVRNQLAYRTSQGRSTWSAPIAAPGLAPTHTI